MKKFYLILSFVILLFAYGYGQCGQDLVDDCASDLGNAVYLKEFSVQLDKAEKNKPVPVRKISVALNKGVNYKFTICNAPEYEGQAIVQLYDNMRLLGSSFIPQTGKMYKEFMFACSKTGVYYLYISFKDGKEGCSATILSYVE